MRHPRRTWLYVAGKEGVDEKVRVRDWRCVVRVWVVVGVEMEMEVDGRREGRRKRWSIETAIVMSECRDRCVMAFVDDEKVSEGRESLSIL